MLVRDPIGAQAEAVGALYGTNGRIERVPGAALPKVRVINLSKTWEFIRPPDRKWRLSTVTFYGRQERVAGRGCDAFGLPITSATLLASLDAFVIGPAGRKVAPFAAVRWFDGTGAVLTGGSLATLQTMRMTGGAAAAGGGTAALRMTAVASAAGSSLTGGAAAMGQVWRFTGTGAATTGGTASATLSHGVTFALTGSAAATTGGTAAVALKPAIAFVAAGGNASTSTGSATLAVTVPAGVVDGDVMIAAWMSQTSGTSPTITLPAGWTQIGSTETFGAASTVAIAAVGIRIASGETAGTTTYTATYSGTPRVAASIAVFRNVANASVAATQDAAVTTTNSGTAGAASPSFPGITTVTNGAWLVGVAAGGRVQTATTAFGFDPPSGYTEDADNGSSTPTSVKQAAVEIVHLGPVTPGAQAAATSAVTPAGATAATAMFTVALAPA